MELQVAEALCTAGLSFVSDMEGNPSGLDFRLSNGVEIEVKRFHSPRIAEQMARADNVIAIQGKEAVRFFAALLHRLGSRASAKAIEARRAIDSEAGVVEDESAVGNADAPKLSL